MAAAFKYNYAVVCRIPDSFGSQHRDVSIGSARDDLEQYVELLRRLGIDVLELPADEKHPECVNVDDTAIVINGTALMCCPPERQGEVNVIRQTLRRELGLKIVEVQNPSKVALEGGDVLFTGKEIIVALSEQTNEAGAQAVASAFPEYATTPVKIPNGYHLKDIVCMGGRDIMIHGCSKTAEDVMRRIKKHATFGYRVVVVDDDLGANCVYANGTLIHLSDMHISRRTWGQIRIHASYGYSTIRLEDDLAANAVYCNGTLVHLSDRQMSTKSFGTLENKIDFPRKAMDIESLLKGQSSLSRIGLLVGKAKYPKKIVSTLD